MLAVAAATTAATAQIYTDMFNFDGIHGNYPTGTGVLAQGRDGNLYGTTYLGGANEYGEVFKITPSGMLTVLYSFNYESLQGTNPFSGLTLGWNGSFYGTTENGGTNDCGTIFKVANESLTTLYSFACGADGAYPSAPPIQGIDGHFYGTTSWGTAYKITAAGAFTLLASLTGGSTASLLQGTDGNLYGTTGDSGSTADGSVFRLTPKGIVTVLYEFDVTHGADPYAAVIQGRDGNLYGTAHQGGVLNEGVVFKLTPRGNITVLHSFPDPNFPNDGYYPIAGLLQATDGNFYGLTTAGGIGNGVLFQITPAGAYSILYMLDGAYGFNPESTPVQHTNGKIYGLATGGGTLGEGVVYSVDLGLAPFVRLVSTSGKAGKTVEILGQGFTGTTAVSFNGTAATFRVFSNTYLTAIVPPDATTGPVTVTTPSRMLTSNQPFRVIPAVTP
jgi:uncharacterized repeat protein (TIGR03803 family)